MEGVCIGFEKAKFRLFFKKVFPETKLSMWITEMIFIAGCNLNLFIFCLGNDHLVALK